MSPAARTQAARALTGPQRCAVLCIALGPEVAVKILQRLAPGELEAVSREIAAMSTVDREVSDAVVAEFQEASKSATSAHAGGLAYASQVLEQAVGPAGAQTLVGRIREDVQERRKFEGASPEALAGALRGEHPQTIALVVAQLGDRQAAGVLQALDPEVAADVLLRVTRLEKVSPEMLALVRQGLASRQDLSLPRSTAARGGAGSVAQVLNRMNEAARRSLLEGVAGRDEDAAAEIKSLMFVFEDLLQLDSKGMQRLLREVDAKELALALKGASDELKAKIRTAMSERAAEALDEEMEILGPVRVKDVEAAHGRIIEQVRALEESGELILRSGDDDVIE